MLVKYLKHVMVYINSKDYGSAGKLLVHLLGVPPGPTADINADGGAPRKVISDVANWIYIQGS